MAPTPLSTLVAEQQPLYATLGRRLISRGCQWLLPVALGLGALLLAATLWPGQQFSAGPAQLQLTLGVQLPGQLAIIIPENNWGWGWALFSPLQITATTNNPLALTANGQQLLIPLTLKVLMPLLALTYTPLLLIAVNRSWRRTAFRALVAASCFLLLALGSFAASYTLAEQPRFLGQQKQSAQLWAIYRDYQRPVPALQRYEIPGQELLYPQQYLPPRQPPGP